MYNKIVHGKIEDIKNIYFETKDGNTQVYSLLSLDDNKKYKIKGVIKGFNNGDNIYLVERNKYAKFFDVINKKTLKIMKKERFVFGAIAAISSIVPISVVYNLWIYKMAYLSYIVNGSLNMLFILFVLNCMPILVLMNLPSNKTIREAKNIINKDENYDIKVDKVYDKERR